MIAIAPSEHTPVAVGGPGHPGALHDMMRALGEEAEANQPELEQRVGLRRSRLPALTC